MQSRTRAAFVERTEVVAFAIVKPDAVYFLTTRSHDPIVAPHVWTAAEFVEIVHQRTGQPSTGGKHRYGNVVLSSATKAVFIVGKDT